MCGIKDKLEINEEVTVWNEKSVKRRTKMKKDGRNKRKKGNENIERDKERKMRLKERSKQEI